MNKWVKWNQTKDVSLYQNKSVNSVYKLNKLRYLDFEKSRFFIQFFLDAFTAGPIGLA